MKILEDLVLSNYSIEELEVIEECVKKPKEFGVGHIEYKAKEPRLIGLVTNELVRAVKQLNKELKEVKEKVK